MNLLPVFSIFIMATLVTGQDSISDCLNMLLDNVRRNPDAACRYFDDYVRCIIRVENLLEIDSALEILEGVESQVNSQISQLGCRVDFSEIFNEMKREADAAVGRGTTSTPASTGHRDNDNSGNDNNKNNNKKNSSCAVFPFGWLTALMVSFIIIFLKQG